MHRIKKQAVSLLLTIMTMMALSAGCGGKEESIQLEDAQTIDSSDGEDSPGTGEEKTAAEKEEKNGTKPDTIFVDVCGQVASPGVYELPAGSRVYEAVAAAGGMLDTASQIAVNQAQKLEDGQQIYIPAPEEAAGMEPAGEQAGNPGTADDGRVNLNTAGQEELMTLTGIGEAKARAIAAYREEHGGFSSPEDIMQVEGFKKGTYEKIKEQIKTE